MLNFLYSHKSDQPLTVNEFLQSLRSTRSPALLSGKLKEHPEYVNDVLNDEIIFKKMGGPDRITMFASSGGLEVCRAIIASNAYKTFDSTIQAQLKTIEFNLEASRYRSAGMKNKTS